LGCNTDLAKHLGGFRRIDRLFWCVLWDTSFHDLWYGLVLGLLESSNTCPHLVYEVQDIPEAYVEIMFGELATVQCESHLFAAC